MIQFKISSYKPAQARVLPGTPVTVLARLQLSLVGTAAPYPYWSQLKKESHEPLAPILQLRLCHIEALYQAAAVHKESLQFKVWLHNAWDTAGQSHNTGMCTSRAITWECQVKHLAVRKVLSELHIPQFFFLSPGNSLEGNEEIVPVHVP